MKHLAFVVLLSAITLSGCSISFSGSKQVDGGIYRSTDSAEHWEQKVFVRTEKKRNITISDYNVSGIYFSPTDANEIIVATYENGIVRTVDGGEVWQITSLSTGHYPTYVFDQKTPERRYTATGTSIYRTENSGETWEIVYTDTRGESISALAVDHYDPSKIVAATASGTILKSVNYGNDWMIKHVIGDTVREFVVHPTDSRLIYAVTKNLGLVSSHDGGETWESMATALLPYPGSTQINQFILQTSNPSTMYLASSYGLLKSTDAGASWVAIKTLFPAGTASVQTIVVDAHNPLLLQFSVNNLIHKSEDGGVTWRTIETLPSSRFINRLIGHPTQSGTLYAGMLKLKK